MNRKLLHTFAVLLTLLGIATARAGTITIVNLPATGTDAATGINTNKHYVCAFNYGNQNTNIYNVNGVPFTHFDPGNQLVNLTNVVDINFGGQVILSSGPPAGSSAACKLARTSNAGQGSLSTQSDGSMYSILTDLIYVGSSAPIGTWLQQEYDYLTVGHPYSLRIYYRYWGNAHGDRIQNVFFNGEGTNQPYSGNPLDEDAGGAHYIEYDFTAAATNVICDMTNLVGNGSMMIYGATLEDTSYFTAPFITYQPKAVVAGNPSVFSVAAIGTSPLTYQWYYNTVSNDSGATILTDGDGVSGSATTNLTITNNLLDYYFVVVTNNYGSVTSSIAQINPLPVVTKPAATNVGNSYVSYSVTAGGFPPLTYQWYFNTVSNSTGATMATDGNGYSGSTTTDLIATTNLQDYYFIIVSNTYGSATSAITAYNPLPTIAAQPTLFRVGNSLGFNVTGGGWPPLGYQWYFNTVSNTSGATTLTDGNGVSGSSTASVTITNYLDYYFVVVTNYYGSVTSRVTQVAVPLTVLAAGEPIWNQTGQTNVIVTFSDLLDPVTATTVGNYSLNNGASILSAAMGGSNEVVLTTSVLTPATTYTLTAQNVKDLFGLVMSPSSTNLTVGNYPANLALWLKADTGVTTDANGVNQWNDLSGNNNNLYDAYGPPYEPQLATNALGDPVIRFTAANETLMYASSSSTLAITGDMSIIAVVNFATLVGGTNGMIVSKTMNNLPAPYDYYVDTVAHLFRGNGTVYGQVAASSGPSIGVPHILVTTMSGLNVTHFLDGTDVGTGVLNNSLALSSIADAGQPLYLGTRMDGVNRLTGDISELIIAGSALSTYDVASLDTYLAETHNLTIVSSSPTNLAYSVSSGQLTLTWPASYTGWELQSNSVSLAATNAWFTIPGSTTTNQVTVPLDAANTNVFYRMLLQ